MTEQRKIKNMKNLIITLLLITSSALHAQKFKSDESYIRFFSDAHLEDIEAVNSESTSIIDVESRAFVFSVPITSFQFQKKLMQEHFNENYLESDKYPKAIFKGKIENWDGSKGKQTVLAKGELELHGISQKVEIESSLDYSDENMLVESVFMIRIEDYKIKVPKAVFYKIAEEVEVTIKFNYAPYAKN